MPAPEFGWGHCEHWPLAMSLLKFKIGAWPSIHRPVGEALGISSLRCSPARKMKKQSVGELPDEVGNEATFLQGLGKIALPCYLLFKESKHNTSYNLVERNSITMFNLNPI